MYKQGKSHGQDFYNVVQLHRPCKFRIVHMCQKL